MTDILNIIVEQQSVITLVETGPQGPKGDKGDKGDPGEVNSGVASVNGQVGTVILSASDIGAATPAQVKSEAMLAALIFG